MSKGEVMLGSIIYAIGGVVEALIGLRFVFQLLGANPASAFVTWVYEWSTPLVAPFAGIFGVDPTIAGPGVVTTSVFDWTALVALLIFGLIFGLLGRLFAHGGSRSL